MNSTHKRYEINNSRVAPASSRSFQNEQPAEQLNKFKQRPESSGSEKEQDDHIANKKPRLSEKNNNNLGSAAFSKHMTSLQQKRKKLQKYKYINQLARLEYEDKLEQVYTKYTKLSKITATKKILAKNQIAQFIQEDQDQNIGYDQLLEFQYGKNKGQQFHFQKQQILDYDFCDLCDCVHNDHYEVHTIICQRKRKEQPQIYSPYSDHYGKESLIRIKNTSEKIKSRQFQQLYILLCQLEKISQQSASILSRQKKIIIQGIKQLKQTNKGQDLFCKVINKVRNLLAKL